ncbi:hypothetical protein [Arthrobacter cavernae]|uniref:hypothetical protein n=1 Tax=Arthrobacter cavernae TaxID=2817681 RepID=UPI001F61E3E2|nr:hypothetical protein [Arthrobacter cavernae]
MRKTTLVVAAVCGMVAFGGVSGSVAGGGTQVEARGGFAFEPNKLVQSTLAWHGGDISIGSGDKLTIVSGDEIPGEPHFFTIVNPDEKPQFIQDLFSGGCQTCNAALDQHFRGVPSIDVGKPGFGEVGDSVAIPDGESVPVDVTAPAGTMLHFMCSLHTEMQGVMEVR